MTEQERPFICYKSGWSTKITPRNARGWWMFGGWMLLTLPLGAILVFAMGSAPSAARTVTGVIAFTLAMLGWGWAMTRWMMARSEIVDLDTLLKIKREQDRAAKRGRL